jgi:hypothetical protein
VRYFNATSGRKSLKPAHNGIFFAMGIEARRKIFAEKPKVHVR